MNVNDPQGSFAISTLDLFDGLTPSVLEEVIARASVRSLPRGHRVFHQGEPIERAHALLSGAVRISQAGSEGEEVVIRFIGPGEIFGSVAIFTDHRYPADGTVMVESTEVSWARAELLNLVTRHPQIALNLVGIIARRLGELQERIREMATQPVERRIASALRRLARQAGRTTERGTQIAFPLRRKDIADISGTTLHTVSRTLSNWRRQGFLIDEKPGLILASAPFHLPDQCCQSKRNLSPIEKPSRATTYTAKDRATARSCLAADGPATDNEDQDPDP